MTAAALADFAEQGVDAAVVEAGLGGRLDATNVLDAPVVVLTNVGLEHTEQLGETRAEIAAEKLAVVREGAAVVLCEPEWRALARSSGAVTTVLTGRSNVALAVAAAETFLGRPVDAAAAEHVALPGRLERRRESPLEIWDGAHNVDCARLAAPAPAGPPLGGRRLDSPRQGRGGNARRSVRRRPDCGGDCIRQSPGAVRRRRCNACETMVRESGDGTGPRRRARTRTIDRGPGRRRPRDRIAVSARGHRGASGRRTIREGTRLSVYAFAADRDHCLCRNRVCGGVRRRKASPVTR